MRAGAAALVPGSLLAFLFLAASQRPDPPPFLVVLGVAQDAGFPQAGTKESPAWDDPELRRLTACLGIVDPATSQRWLIDATPDFKEQLHSLDRLMPVAGIPGLDGIFLTHGHMGHYLGLAHLGREAMNARGVAVYAMPRMEAFLRDNGPWSLLVRLGNIRIRALADRKPVRLNPRLSITPLAVPHRAEYTETVGFTVRGPKRAALFIPDIDKWELWDEQGVRLEDELAAVDIALLDGTFFADGELPGRPMSEVPHPFIAASIRRFSRLSQAERKKVRFIHLNRTNPALIPGGDAQRAIESAGFWVAREQEMFDL